MRIAVDRVDAVMTHWSPDRTSRTRQRRDCAVALQSDRLDQQPIQFLRWYRRRLAVLGLLLPLLAGCGGNVAVSPADTAAAPTATPAALVQVAVTETAVAAATANQQDVLAFQTAQASAQAKTATPTAVPLPTDTPAPTSTPAPAVSPKAGATPTPYVADFSTWPTATPVPATPVRVSYDAKNQQYVIAVTDPTWPNTTASD
jgi:hypothetical protein